MNADLLISMVLNEGRSTPVFNGTPSYERRASRFNRNVVPEYSTRVVSGGTFDSDGSIGNSRVQAGHDFLDSLHIIQTRERIFGPRLKNPRHEDIKVHLLPTLAAHIEDEKTTPDQQIEARKEFDKHIHNVAKSIHKATIRRLRKHPIKDLSGGVAAHDALEHGTSGALPSDFGEIQAAHMRDLSLIPIRIPRSMSLSDTENEKRVLKLKSDLTNNYLLGPMKKRGLSNLSHDEIMDWSRSFK